MRPQDQPTPLTGRQKLCPCRSERWRWDLNPRTGCPLTRFRGLGAAVRHRPRPSVTWAEGHAVVADERPRTEVNETRTETRRLAAPVRPGTRLNVVKPGPKIRPWLGARQRPAARQRRRGSR